MTRYRVGALITGMIFDEIIAESEDEAIEKMCDKYGDRSIVLCANCSNKVSGLSVSEDTEMYEAEELETIV